MPFQVDNPNRNRNFLILAIALVVSFALVMTAYVALSLAGRDTDDFLRFLTIIVVTLVPSTLAAFRANTAAQNTQQATVQLDTVQEKVANVEDKLNGTLDEMVTRASAEGTKQALREVKKDGRPPV